MTISPVFPILQVSGLREKGLFAMISFHIFRRLGLQERAGERLGQARAPLRFRDEGRIQQF